MATTLALALGTGLAVALIGFMQARRERDRAEQFNRGLRRRRGHDGAREAFCTGLWQDSLESCQKPMAAYPDDVTVTPLLAVSALLARQPQTYRDQCQQMLSRYGRTTNNPYTQELALTCRLAPDPTLDLSLVLRLADVSLAQNPRDLWLQLTKGPAECRAGHHEEAIRFLQPIRTQRQAPISCSAGYLIALARHRFNEPTESQAALQHPRLRFKECVRQLACASKLSDCFEPAAAIVLCGGAEHTMLGREVSSKVDGRSLAALRTSSATVRRLMRRGVSLSRAKDWRAAAIAFHGALQKPAFDWVGTAVDEGSTMWPDIAMGVAFVRAGDGELHKELCRHLVWRVNESYWPPRHACTAARTCLLSPVLPGAAATGEQLGCSGCLRGPRE